MAPQRCLHPTPPRPVNMLPNMVKRAVAMIKLRILWWGGDSGFGGWADVITGDERGEGDVTTEARCSHVLVELARNRFSSRAPRRNQTCQHLNFLARYTFFFF